MKEKISFLLFLFSALTTYGQVTLAISEVKDLKVNQRFNLTVLLEISGENMEQETPLRMPDFSKFEVVGSASERNTVVLDGKSGNVINQLVYQYVLAPKQAGKIKFGSVLVTVNGKIYMTEPFEINVRDNEKKSSVAEHTAYNDVYLNLELENNKVYQNEPVVAVLRAYSKNYGNFRKINSIQFSSQKNAKIRPLSYAKSEIETRGDLSSQVVGKFLIFPNESGNIEINSASALVSNATKPQQISSNKTRINVRRLPTGMPRNFNNAVGKFDIFLAQHNSNELSEIEKPVNISLRVSGEGNFSTMQLPKILNSPDYISFPPQVTSQIKPTKTGLTGQIIADYVIIPKKNGLISIGFENFSYFNLAEKNYVDLGAKSIELHVKTKEEIANAKTTFEKMNEYTNTVLETVNTPVLQTQHLKIKNKNSINWGAVLGNFSLMVAVISLFLIVRKRTRKKIVKAAAFSNTPSSIAETEEIIRKKATHHYAENIEYLKKLRQDQDFESFFEAYQELNNDVKRYLSVNNETEFKNYILQNKGAQIAAEYNILTEKIQMEKFAPFPTEEHIDALLNSIATLYAEIIK